MLPSLAGPKIEPVLHTHADEQSARVLDAGSDSFFHAIFHAAALGIGICTPEGRIVLSNPALQRMLGYKEEELCGKHFRDFTHPDDVGTNEQLFEQLKVGARDTYEMEKRYIRKDGSVMWARLDVSRVDDCQGVPVFSVGMVDDISERKRTQEQLIQAQKLEAVGRVAGGVAHDFNNLLTGILLYSDLLVAGSAEGNALHRHAEEIRFAAEQGAALVQQLLRVTRTHPVEPTLLCLNETVKAMSRLLTRLIGEDLELKTDLDPHLWLVRMDPVHAQQVLLNLVINARDAMPRGGRIVLATRNAVPSVLRNGERRVVTLTVSDTGCGMDPETRSHLFEPFFTTKKPGKGSGLGLATVYRIVHDSDGAILVESEVGSGTRIEISLPGVLGDQENAPATSTQEIAQAQSPPSSVHNAVETHSRHHGVRKGQNCTGEGKQVGHAQR